MEYIDSPQDVREIVDGEAKRGGVLKDTNSSSVYLEIYGGGTGIFLEFKLSDQ
jgi:hypothetical protein